MSIDEDAKDLLLLFIALLIVSTNLIRLRGLIATLIPLTLIDAFRFLDLLARDEGAILANILTAGNPVRCCQSTCLAAVWLESSCLCSLELECRLVEPA